MSNDFQQQKYLEWKESKKISSVIEVTLNVEGVHSWSDILEKETTVENRILNEVKYLGHKHRHTFQISITLDVSHTNRDLEFICVRHDIERLLYNKFYNDELRLLDFGNRSCEMICEEILELYYFDLNTDYEDSIREIKVSEDKEFFGILTIN